MSTKSRLMLGIISYLKSDLDFLQDRISCHKCQLEFWEAFTEFERVSRVEIAWSADTASQLRSPLITQHLETEAPSPVGKSRNILLKEFYGSDFDWLVCCDDDTILDPIAEAADFLQQLSPVLARKACLIIFTPECWLDRAGVTRAFNLRVTYPKHVLQKANLKHGMSVCCIPNLVKYGRDPIWFHEANTADANTPTEDAAYFVDWIKAGNPVYEAKDLFTYQLDNSNRSAVFGKQANRASTKAARMDALNTYVATKFSNRVQTIDAVGRLKNPAVDPIYINLGAYGRVSSIKEQQYGLAFDISQDVSK